MACMYYFRCSEVSYWTVKRDMLEDIEFLLCYSYLGS
jgi:hypothetical protein